MSLATPPFEKARVSVLGLLDTLRQGTGLTLRNNQIDEKDKILFNLIFLLCIFALKTLLKENDDGESKGDVIDFIEQNFEDE